MHKISRKGIRSMIATGGAAVMIGTSLIAGSGVSTAEDLSNELGFGCEYPLIGEQPLTTDVAVNMPDVVDGGHQPAYPVEVETDFGEILPQAMLLVGAYAVDGTQRIRGVLHLPRIPDRDFEIEVPFPRQPIPTGGALVVNGGGQLPPFHAPAPGEGAIEVTGTEFDLRPVRPDGSNTGLGEVTVPCRFAPADQDATVHEFTVVRTPRN